MPTEVTINASGRLVTVYPKVVKCGYLEALGGNPQDKAFFEKCLTRDLQTHQWCKSLDPAWNACLLLHVRAGRMPSPVDFFDELVVRYPFLATHAIRDWFLSNARASPEPRNDKWTARCPLCASNWAGFWVRDHDIFKCPIFSLPDERDRQKFYISNTVASCGSCGARSPSHTKCDLPHPCGNCDIEGHQRQFFVCHDTPTQETLEALFKEKWEEHFTRVAQLAEDGLLRFPLHTDWPDQTHFRSRAAGQKYICIGPYEDKEGRFPPIPAEKYQAYALYQGLMHAESLPSKFLCIFKLTDMADFFQMWENAFRKAADDRRKAKREANQRSTNQRTEPPANGGQGIRPPTGPPKRPLSMRVEDQFPVILAPPKLPTPPPPKTDESEMGGEDTRSVTSVPTRPIRLTQQSTCPTASQGANLSTSKLVRINGPDVVREAPRAPDSKASNEANGSNVSDSDVESERSVNRRSRAKVYEWIPTPTLDFIKENVGTMLAEKALRTYILQKLDGTYGTLDGARVGCPSSLIEELASVPLPSLKAEVIERIATWQVLLTGNYDWHPGTYEDCNRNDCFDYLGDLEKYGRVWLQNPVIYGFRLEGGSVDALKKALESPIKALPTLDLYYSDGYDTMNKWIPRYSYERFQTREPATFEHTWFNGKATEPIPNPGSVETECGTELLFRENLNKLENEPAHGTPFISKHSLVVLKELIERPDPYYIKTIVYRIGTFLNELAESPLGFDPTTVKDWAPYEQDKAHYQQYLSLLRGAARVVMKCREANNRVEVLVSHEIGFLKAITRSVGVLAIPSFELFRSVKTYEWSAITEVDWTRITTQKSNLLNTNPETKPETE